MQQTCTMPLTVRALVAKPAHGQKDPRHIRGQGTRHHKVVVETGTGNETVQDMTCRGCRSHHRPLVAAMACLDTTHRVYDCVWIYFEGLRHTDGFDSLFDETDVHAEL